jgi:AcrR family transcriptional regulator
MNDDGARPRARPAWELPASIEAAWGLRERPHKGPKPGLSLPRIVEAGVKVAQAEGLAAVSMSRVAAELGSAPMSLYRYVSAKDELIALMVDAAWGPAPEAVPGEGWRKGLSRWAWAMRAAFQANAWAVQVPISGLPVRPNEVAWFELGLASLAGTSLTETQKASVIMLLSGYIRAEATTGADIARAIASSGLSPDDWMASYGRMLATVTDPVRYPAITRFIAAGVFDVHDGPDDEFIFSLERILDGIETLVRAQSAPPPDGPGATEQPSQPEQAGQPSQPEQTKQTGQAGRPERPERPDHPERPRQPE